MRRLQFALLMLVVCLLTFEGAAAQVAYPQVVRMRYEAVEPKGGSFVIWLDRERVHHGLDAKLYPPVRYVEITHLTPPGLTEHHADRGDERERDRAGILSCGRPRTLQDDGDGRQIQQRRSLRRTSTLRRDLKSRR